MVSLLAAQVLLLPVLLTALLLSLQQRSAKQQQQQATQVLSRYKASQSLHQLHLQLLLILVMLQCGLNQGQFG
jgi:hypothetical protein